MSTAKFEKLIDLIINEDQERAEQLFHEIVVEKSREIYESLMDEEELDEDMTTGLMQEIEAEEEEGGMMEMDGEEEEIEAGDFDVEGGDDMDDMGDDDMGDMDDMGDDDMGDMGSEEPATKDDIMDLEDKLDQLMSAFEEEFGSMSDDEEEMDMDSDEEEMDMDSDEEESGVMESVELKKVAPPKHGDDGVQKKSPVAANAGAAGMASKPVSFSGTAESNPTSAKKPANAYSKGETQVKGAGSFQNSPGGASGVKGGKGEAAPKPETKQASGVNTKDIVPESRKIVKKMIK